MKSDKPWVTWHTLSYIKFEGGSPEMYTNKLNDVCSKVHFLTKLQAVCLQFYQSYASLQVFFKIFAQLSIKRFSKF